MFYGTGDRWHMVSRRVWLATSDEATLWSTRGLFVPSQISRFKLVVARMTTPLTFYVLGLGGGIAPELIPMQFTSFFCSWSQARAQIAISGLPTRSGYRCRSPGVHREQSLQHVNRFPANQKWQKYLDVFLGALLQQQYRRATCSPRTTPQGRGSNALRFDSWRTSCASDRWCETRRNFETCLDTKRRGWNSGH